MSDTCRELRTLLSGYHDGELSPVERRLVEEHLASCLPCRDALAAYTVADEAITSGEIERPEEEWERLALRVDEAVAAEPDPGEVPDATAGSAVASVRDTGREAPGPSRFLLASLTPRRLAFGSLGTLVAVLLVALLLPLRQELGPGDEPAPRRARIESESVGGPGSFVFRKGSAAGIEVAPAEEPVVPDRVAPAPEAEARRKTGPKLPDLPREIPANVLSNPPREVDWMSVRDGERYVRGGRLGDVPTRLGPEKQAASPELSLGAAWPVLLLESEEALASEDVERILRITLGLEALAAGHVEDDLSRAIADRGVLLWARLARLDRDRFCAPALERVTAWERSRGGGPDADRAREAARALREEFCAE